MGRLGPEPLKVNVGVKVFQWDSISKLGISNRIFLSDVYKYAKRSFAGSRLSETALKRNQNEKKLRLDAISRFWLIPYIPLERLESSQ